MKLAAPVTIFLLGYGVLMAVILSPGAFGTAHTAMSVSAKE